MAFGGKVGEAWVEIHARGSTNSTDLKRIAERDAEAYADSWDDLVNEKTDQRIRRTREQMAQAFDERDFGRLVKMFGDIDKAVSGSTQTLEEWQKRGQIDGNRMRSYRRILKEMRNEYVANEEAVAALAEREADLAEKRRMWAAANARQGQGRNRWLEEQAALRRASNAMVQFTAEHDKLLEARRRMDDRTLAQIIIGDDDPQAIIKHYGDHEKAFERLRGRLLELGNSSKITVAQFRAWGETLNDWTAEQEAATRAAAEHEEQMRRGTEMAKDREAQMRNMVKSLDTIRKEREKLRRDAVDRNIADLIFSDHDAEDVSRRIRQTGTSFTELRDRLKELRDNGEITSRQMRRSFRQMAQATRRDIRQTGEAVEGLGGLTVHVGRRYEVFANNWQRNTARAFGKGSRNNFLNFTGALTGLAVGIAAFPLRLLSRFASGIANVFAKVGQLRATGMGLLPSLLSAVAPLLISATTAIVGFGVAIAAVATIVPVMISAINLLIGALTVLIGTLVTALLGGIVALLPVLAALGVGLGGAALVAKAFAENSDEAKKALEGFTDVFDELVKKAEPIMEDVLEQVLRLSDEFEELGGVALAAADGMAGGFRRFVDNLEDPRLEPFLTLWGVTIPRVVESLSNALADFTTGLIAWLAPVLPYAEELADNIERAAERFKEWALSTEGQDSISGWLEIAWEAAGKLWNTLVNIGDILGTIFTSATDGGGNDFLGWLERVTEEWGTFLKSEEGQQSMRDFWSAVSDFAEDVKDFIKAAVDAWNSLDTETSRENLSTLLGIFESIAEIVETLAPHIEDIAAGVADFLGAIAYELERVEKFLTNLGIIKPQWKIDGEKMGEEAGREMNTGLNIGLNSRPLEFNESQQIRAAELYERGRALGVGLATALNTGVLVGLDKNEAAIGFENWSPFEGEGPLIDANETGQAIVDEMVRGIRSGVIEIPASVRGEAIRAMTDVQRTMLENAGIDPEKLARALDAREGLARFTSMLVEDMTASATSGSDAFRHQFGAGMGGWTSEIAPKALELAAGISTAFGVGADRVKPTMAQKALDMAMGISGSFGVGLDEFAFQMAVKMANGVIAMTQAAQNMVGGVEGQFSTLAGKVKPSMDSTISTIASKMGEGVNTMARRAQDMVSNASSTIGTLPGKASSALAPLAGRIGSQMSAAASRARAGAGSIVSGGANIGGMVSRAAAAISGLAGAIASRMSTAYNTALHWARLIRNAMSSANVGVNIGIGGGMASGGIVYGPGRPLIGEAGPEAVVPLNRPLSQVDPSVRALSAIAQGLSVPSAGGRGLYVAEGAVRVTTNVQDPTLVAESLMDHIFAAAQD